MALYDLHAHWYEDYLHGSAGEHTARVASLLVSLLGRGSGMCLDVCCGTGVHAPALSALGWRPVGVEVSAASGGAMIEVARRSCRRPPRHLDHGRPMGRVRSATIGKWSLARRACGVSTTS